jgi:hypothetical protein
MPAIAASGAIPDIGAACICEMDHTARGAKDLASCKPELRTAIGGADRGCAADRLSRRACGIGRKYSPAAYLNRL